MLKDLANTIVTKTFGTTLGKWFARFMGNRLSVLVLVIFFVYQVLTFLGLVNERIEKLRAAFPFFSRRSDVNVIVSGDPVKFYPAQSKILLSVEVVDKKYNQNRIEAKENQLALFTVDGKDAGFEKEYRFPAPMRFYNDNLPPSEYSLVAEFYGNDKANQARSAPYGFTVFEQDSFDPQRFPTKWNEVPPHKTQQVIPGPFMVVPNLSSHKGEFVLTMKPGGSDLNRIPLLWYRTQVPFPCEVRVVQGPIGIGSSFVVSLDDVFRIVVGFHSDDSNLKNATGLGLSAPSLSVYENDRAHGTFSRVGNILLPLRLLLNQHEYHFRVQEMANKNGQHSYRLQFDAVGEFAVPVRAEFSSSLAFPRRGQIGLGLVSKTSDVYVESFEAFGIPSTTLGTQISTGPQ